MNTDNVFVFETMQSLASGSLHIELEQLLGIYQYVAAYQDMKGVWRSVNVQDIDFMRALGNVVVHLERRAGGVS